MKRFYIWFLVLAGVVLFLAPLVAQQVQTMFGQGASYGEIMRGDHQQISNLLNQLAQAQDRQQRREILNLLKDGLGKHMKAEELYLYSRLEKNPETKGIAVRAQDEHMAAKAQLMRIDPAAEEMVFSSRLEVLKALIDSHVNFEEGKLLEKAMQVLGDQDNITEQFKRAYR